MYVLIHGTNRESANNIMKNGFSISEKRVWGDAQPNYIYFHWLGQGNELTILHDAIEHALAACACKRSHYNYCSFICIFIPVTKADIYITYDAQNIPFLQQGWLYDVEEIHDRKVDILLSAETVNNNVKNGNWIMKNINIPNLYYPQYRQLYMDFSDYDKVYKMNPLYVNEFERIFLEEESLKIVCGACSYELNQIEYGKKKVAQILNSYIIAVMDSLENIQE